MSSEIQGVCRPHHVAIIMDGNGRWASQRGMPRAAGHKAGVTSLRNIVQHSAHVGIDILTVYAFSSENWRRPGDEVSLLLELFISALKEEVDELHKNNVKLCFIGNRREFPDKLQRSIEQAEMQTADNTGLHLVVAANYGGRWDITRAVRKLLRDVQSGKVAIADIDENLLGNYLCLANLPEVDLFIRTGGESRISNYLLWQLAYTEMYFTEVLWPDFTPAAFDEALQWFTGRQRRFGRTSEQVRQSNGA